MKKIKLIALSLSLIFLFGACGNSKDTTSSNLNASTSTPTSELVMLTDEQKNEIKSIVEPHIGEEYKNLGYVVDVLTVSGGAKVSIQLVNDDFSEVENCTSIAKDIMEKLLTTDLNAVSVGFSFISNDTLTCWVDIDDYSSATVENLKNVWVITEM